MKPLVQLREPGRIRGLLFDVGPERLRQEFVFTADSPSDAPMCVTRGAAGAGFAELVAHLIGQLPGER